MTSSAQTLLQSALDKAVQALKDKGETKVVEELTADEEMRGLIKIIESNPVELTQNHYGTYMGLISKGSTPFTQTMIALKLFANGANANGVLTALKLTSS
jgi:hypothetical protein